MRKLLMALMLVGLAGMVWAAAASIYCDYHMAYAYWQGAEYRNGKCFDVYTHEVGTSRRVCKIVIPCN